MLMRISPIYKLTPTYKYKYEGEERRERERGEVYFLGLMTRCSHFSSSSTPFFSTLNSKITTTTTKQDHSIDFFCLFHRYNNINNERRQRIHPTLLTYLLFFLVDRENFNKTFSCANWPFLSTTKNNNNNNNERIESNRIIYINKYCNEEEKGKMINGVK